MAIDIAVITAGLAGLTVTANGRPILIKDWSGIHAQADARDMPIFQPDVTRQITLQVAQVMTLGSSVSSLKTATYTLPYVLFHAPVGSERDMNIHLPAIVAEVEAMLDALFIYNKPTRTTSLSVAGFTLGQTVSDPSGAQFHGATIDLQITKLIN